jgi:hypothetical protein
MLEYVGISGTKIVIPARVQYSGGVALRVVIQGSLVTNNKKASTASPVIGWCTHIPGQAM